VTGEGRCGDVLAHPARLISKRLVWVPNTKGSAAREKRPRIHDSDRPDLFVRDTDLAQIGDRISDVKEVSEWITLIEHVHRPSCRDCNTEHPVVSQEYPIVQTGVDQLLDHRRPLPARRRLRAVRLG
jgi:hypothetical protein